MGDVLEGFWPSNTDGIGVWGRGEQLPRPADGGPARQPRARESCIRPEWDEWRHPYLICPPLFEFGDLAPVSCTGDMRVRQQWRRERDSNPRESCGPSGLQVPSPPSRLVLTGEGEHCPELESAPGQSVWCCAVPSRSRQSLSKM